MTKYDLANNSQQLWNGIQNHCSIFSSSNTKLSPEVSRSWDTTQRGLAQLNLNLHEMESVLYYASTAILAKENILIQGPGGGAKTLALRKVFEAEIAHRIRSAKTKEDKDNLKNEIKIFLIQFHQMLSETKILGGPNPFSIAKDSNYDVEIGRALISPKNKFAILDEFEKAPVALQMTLLSIMQERQAFSGNKLFQTMLESIGITSNASTAELISQGNIQEVGGRMALLDRMAVKIFVVNAEPSAQDNYLMLMRVREGKQNKDVILVDLAGLRQLIDQINIPLEMLSGSAVNIALSVDRQNSDRLNKAISEVSGTQAVPKFYPAFSGSTRTHAKVIRLWKSAFLARQLLSGVPSHRISLTMQAKDLIDLSVALLQGGPDIFMTEKKIPIPFLLTQWDKDNELVVLTTNTRKPSLNRRYLSIGHFDVNSGTFEYKNAQGLLRRLYFDPVTGKLIHLDNSTKMEIESCRDAFCFMTLKSSTQIFADVSANISRKLKKIQNPKTKSTTPLYTSSGRIDALLAKAPLRQETRDQLTEIKEINTEFLLAVNAEIESLKGKQLTSAEAKKAEYIKALEAMKTKAEVLRRKMQRLFESGNKHELNLLAMESFAQVYEEMVKQFSSSDSEIESLMAGLGVSAKNIMLFGGPGSAKTLKSQLLIDAAVSTMTEAQLHTLNKSLTEMLIKANLIDNRPIAHIKQFHPMSNEGEIVGRPDLRSWRNGEGLKYTTTGTLAEKNVFYALLDEFEKAPPGVRTALLSLLNERELFVGDELIKSNIISFIITTNASPSDFLIGMGEFSTAFPIYDRIQKKVFSFNKLSVDELREFYLRIYFGLSPKIFSPLFTLPLNNIAKKFTFGKGVENSSVEEALVAMHTDIMKNLVDLSEPQRSVHNSDPEISPEYFMNTRGESNRSFLSIFENGELASEILVKRILERDEIEKLANEDFKFKFSDIESFANLYMTANPFIRIRLQLNADGTPGLKIDEKTSDVDDRLTPRDRVTIKYIRDEANVIVSAINKHLSDFINTRKQIILSNPNLFPSLFVNREKRIQYLLQSGFTKQEVEKYYGSFD